MRVASRPVDDRVVCILGLGEGSEVGDVQELLDVVAPDVETLSVRVVERSGFRYVTAFIICPRPAEASRIVRACHNLTWRGHKLSARLAWKRRDEALDAERALHELHPAARRFAGKDTP